MQKTTNQIKPMKSMPKKISNHQENSWRRLKQKLNEKQTKNLRSQAKIGQKNYWLNRAQTGRLEETKVSSDSVHSGGILEEEGKLGSTIGIELEDETEIGVTWDNGIFSVTWSSIDSGGEDTSTKWISLRMITLWVEVSNNL